MTWAGARAFAELIEIGAECVVIVVDRLAKVDEYFGVEEYGEPLTKAALKNDGKYLTHKKRLLSKVT